MMNESVLYPRFSGPIVCSQLLLLTMMIKARIYGRHSVMPLETAPSCFAEALEDTTDANTLVPELTIGLLCCQVRLIRKEEDVVRNDRVLRACN